MSRDFFFYLGLLFISLKSPNWADLPTHSSGIWGPRKNRTIQCAAVFEKYRWRDREDWLNCSLPMESEYVHGKGCQLIAMLWKRMVSVKEYEKVKTWKKNDQLAKSNDPFYIQSFWIPILKYILSSKLSFFTLKSVFLQRNGKKNLSFSCWVYSWNEACGCFCLSSQAQTELWIDFFSVLIYK